MDRKFTLSMWYRERKTVASACPWCDRRGFYDPHIVDKRFYAMCKSCGVVQDVGGKPIQCRINKCPVFDCRYSKWTMRKEPHDCPHCHIKMKVIISYPNL